MKSMFAFLAGIFLVFIGYSLGDRGNATTPASGVVVKPTEAEQKLMALSQVISPAAMILGGILIAGSLFFVLKKGRQGGRYD